MADLYSLKTYTFEALQKKHEGFFAPSCLISVGGKDIIKDLGFCFDSVSVVQTINAKSGSCRFNIVNAYDTMSGGFKSGFDGMFPLGETVEVKLGYKIQELVFKGFIGDVSFSFSAGSLPRATISCFDIRRLMMQGRRSVTLAKAQFDTVASELLKYYESLIEFKNACKDKHNKEESFNQTSNDFDYINDYAKKRGYDFFVLGDKAYLQEIHAQKEPLIELEWGEALLTFSCSHAYNANKIEGTITDYSSGEPITENAETTKPKYKQLQVTSEPVVVRIETPEVKNPEDLKKVVEGEKKKRELEAKSGSATCIGLPELIPARFVSFGKMDKAMVDDKFFVREVTHEFSNGGFFTTLSFSNEGASSTSKGSLASSLTKNEKKSLPLSVRKVVDNNYEDEKPACVKLDIPGQEGVTDWVRVAMPFACKDAGFYFMPEKDSEVLIGYCDGDINKPVVIGSLYNKMLLPPSDLKDEENNKKCIKTKSGHIFKFDDTKDNTLIEIQSAGKLSLKLDDAKKLITISDSKGENVISIDEEKGELSLAAKTKIVLSVDSNSISIDKNSKSIALSADTIDIKPSKSLNLEGQQIKLEGQQLNIKGQTTVVEAGGQMDVKSSGMLNLKGTMVKLN